MEDREINNGKTETAAESVKKVPKRILASLMNAVAAGVVPRSGAPYMAIGREEEVAALLHDLETVNDGGASMRFIVGKYGSGKSFLMQLMRGYSLERGFLTADADLSPERRICGAKGVGLATYRELIRNLACRASPDGGALTTVISHWLSGLSASLASEGTEPGSAAFSAAMDKKIYSVARELEGLVGGFDFASVVSAYYRAEMNGDEESKSACLRWLRGEYANKTEARANGLRVSAVIGDDNWHDMLKLLAAFSRLVGYRGLVVFIDECVNLYKITNRVSRENNYEKLLAMYNDTLQGRASGLAMIFGGTPQFLEDTRRGLFSYEALRSRLCDSRFAAESGYRDLLGPVIRLRRLSDDELYALLTRMTRLHGQFYEWEPRITDGEMTAFLRLCLERAGADSMITPREILRDYLAVLGILLQHPETTASSLIGGENNAVTLSHGGADPDDDLDLLTF